jgi:hypothetical protein
MGLEGKAMTTALTPMKDVVPQLIADVTFYPTEHGGRSVPTGPDWFGCPCKVHKEDVNAWDCRILLQGQPLSPGDTRRVGMVFLSGEKAASILREAGKFYLWELGIIGEARVIPGKT